MPATMMSWGNRTVRRRAAGPVLAALIALLAGACASTPGSREIFLPEPPKLTDSAPQGLREHQRVLAAYGGAYEDPKLQAVLTRVVNRLVAASERPELTYKVTILNSPAVNAFALPTGQLYVTRGLLGLANDSSELASVVSHEIAHVIARHADMREEQARRAELVNNVVNDVLSDPQDGAMALARSKLALASFSRAQEFEADGIGVGIAARSGYDPFGAARFLTSMGRNADFRAVGRSRDNRPLDFLSSHPATPERVKSARNSARQLAAPGPGERDKATYLAEPRRPRLRRGSDRGLRARPPLPPSQARLHLHRARRLFPRQHRPGGAGAQGQRQPGAAARCREGAGRADADRISQLRLDRERRSGLGGGTRPSTASRRRPRPPRATNGRSASMPSASAAKSTASSSPPRPARRKPSARSARPSAPSAGSRSRRSSRPSRCA